MAKVEKVCPSFNDTIAFKQMGRGVEEILYQSKKKGITSHVLIEEGVRSYVSNISQIHKGPPLERPTG